ncbi:MAG: COG1361 family protein [Planctomycetota bacterium]|jgi:uncharacterized repeat protein (TIGR01451 family)
MNYLKLALLVLAAGCQSTGGAGSGESGSDAKRDAQMTWIKRAYPTGKRSTSALLVERGLPAEVQSGQRYEYEIRVTNLTDMVLTNVVLTDTAPNGFEVAEGAAAAEIASGIATWTIGELKGGATITLRASALAGEPGSFRHLARVTYDAPLAGTTTIVQPRLELERSAPETVVQADGISVTYTVRNAGTGTARDVVVEEALPEGFTTEEDGADIRIKIGALRAGEIRTVKRQINASNAGPFESSAKATAFGGLSAATERRVVKVTTPTLRATVAAPARAAIGQVYTLTLTLGNDGDGPARDATAQLTLPKGTAFVDSDAAPDSVKIANGKLVWRPGTMEPGSESKLAIRLRAASAEMFSFVGRAQAHGCDPVDMNAAVEQYGIATVDIEVGDEIDPVLKGSQAVYTVTVRNQGTATATNVKLICKLEAGMSFVEAGGASKGAAVDGTITLEPVAELAAKTTLTWRIVVTGETAGDRRFHVEVSADQLDRPVEASESTRFFE